MNDVTKVTDLKEMGMFEYYHIRELLSVYITRNDRRSSLYDSISDFDHDDAYACWLPEKKIAAMTNNKGQYLYAYSGGWKIINE